MWTVIRHLLAIVTLPVMVTIAVPIWIARRYDVGFDAPEGVAELTLVLIGAVALVAGVALFLVCLRRFAIDGHGTLAPWDPPRRLVLRGAYRHVRNPMISGVILVLFGESLALRSLPHALWAATFAAINCVYIPLLEEPRLEARFGDEYREYRRRVPRFLPRLRPWMRSDP